MAVGSIAKVSVSNIGTTSFTVSWVRPSNTTKFNVAVRDVTNGNKVTNKSIAAFVAVGQTLNFSFSGLSPAHSYEIEVTPYNGTQIGNSQYYYNSKSFPHYNTVTTKAVQQQQQKTPTPTPKSATSSTTNNASVTKSPGSPSKASTPATTEAKAPAPVDMTGKASISVPGLQLNQTYTVQIVAELTLPDGSLIHSPYARVTVKTPAKAPATNDAGDNVNFSNQNTNADIRLNGGSIFAGSFGPDTGAIDVALDSPEGSGVILNKTGLAGFADGVKEFYIDARTGKAYFAGNITAGTVKIGPDIDPTGTKSGLYINASNYWYEDGTWSANGGDIAGALVSTTILKPFAVTAVVPTWVDSGFKVAFTSDPSSIGPNNSNQYLDHYEITLTGQFTSKVFYSKPISGSAQTFTLSIAENRAAFGLVQSSLSGSIVAVDSFGNKSAAALIPATQYYSQLPVPVITVEALNNSYSVKYTTPTDAMFNVISIEEKESNSGTAPAFDEPPSNPLNVVYTGTSNPAIIPTINTNKRWVRARFYDDLGATTSYSAAVAVQPTSPVNLDLNPPNEVSSASASWSGENVVLNYTLPSNDPGIRFVAVLTAPNTQVGFFYFFPDGSANLSQSHTITKTDLFNQFGEHYSSFTGVLKSIDANDNRTPGLSFNVPVRANPLTGVVPTFTTIPLSNAYSVNFTLPTGAKYAEVYAKHTVWTGDPTDDTYVVYAGLSPAVIVDTDYTPVYIKIRYYDDFGNTSSYSTQTNNSVTPANPGQITSFENPITFGTNAVIYAGASHSSGNRTLFKSSGIFAYDATSVEPTTQIISSAAAGTPTFITKRAEIADWSINETSIENTLTTRTNDYTGLSASGTYAFWAGSDTSGGSASANFYVKNTGEVQAKNINIAGGSLTIGSSSIQASTGKLVATDAEITGKITASSGDFTGNVQIGILGSLYSGVIVPGSGTTPPSLSGQGFILNKNGLKFLDSSSIDVTTIDGTTGKLYTKFADIGGWTVSSTAISRTTGSGTIKLDATNAQIEVSGYGLYTAGIASPTAAAASDTVIWAGASKSNPSFKVTADGSVSISGNVSIGGYATSGTVSAVAGSVSTIDSKTSKLDTSGNINAGVLLTTTGSVYSGKDSYTSTTNGYYIGYNGSNPAIKIGSSTNYLSYDTGTNILEVTGKITASSGYIGGATGWIINPTNIISSNSSLTLSGLTGIITSTGQVPVGGGLVDVGYTETYDDGTTFTTISSEGAPTNTAPRTLTITPGYIKSDSYLTLWSTNAFEVFQTAGTTPLLSFDTNKSIITSKSMVVGKAIRGQYMGSNGVTVYYDDRYNSDPAQLSGFHVNGFARVRNATPTGPKTTGYFRNIYIGTSNNPGTSTGLEGAIYMQY